MRFQRELTAAVLIPAVLGLLIKGPTWGWALLVALACALALVEFFGLIRAAGWIVPRWVALALLLAILFAQFRGSHAALVGLVAATLVVIPALVMFASPPESILLPSTAASAFAVLYVAAGGAAFIGLRALGWRPVLFLLLIVWAGDSAAYYVGRRWGKRKLAPVVSPKKTWAGLFGQLGAGTLLGAVLGYLWSGGAGAWLVALFTAGVGLLLSVVAVIGDLVESTFKRSCAVKDSGGLLPGHGGLLDRLDSLLYAGPVLLIALTLAPWSLPR